MLLPRTLVLVLIGPAIAFQTAPGPGVQKTALAAPVEVDTPGSVSPDGRRISFLAFADRHANVGVWDLRAGTTRTLTKFDNLRDAGLIWSPDGRRLAVSAEWAPDQHRDIRIIDVNTGADSVVTPIDAGLDVATILAWSPDGRLLAAGLGRSAGEATVGTAQLALISVADGRMTPLKTFEGSMPSAAAFSRDSAFLAYDFAPRKDSPMRDVFVISVDGRKDTPLAADAAANETLLAWRANGRVLYTSERDGVRDVFTMTVHDGRRVGGSALVAHDVDHLTPLGVTDDGRLFVNESATTRDVYVVNVDPASGKAAGPPVPLPEGQPRMNRKEATWSPDGARIAFVEFREGQAEAVVVQTSAGDRRVYPVPVRALDHPLWMPDGSAFLFDGTGTDDQQRMFKLDLSTGAVTKVTDCVCFVHAISPDGRYWYQGGPKGLERRDAQDSSATLVASPEETDGTIGSSKLSPDGRWFAFFTHRPQPGALAIRAANGGPRRELTGSFNFGYTRLAWTPDSRYVIFQKVPGGLFRLPIDGGSEEALGVRPGTLWQLSMNADGRRLALDISTSHSGTWVWQLSER